MAPPILAHLESSSCILMTDHLTRYALVGGPPRDGTAVKNMQLVAVTSNTHHSNHEPLSLRIYCLEDTKAALEVGKFSLIQIEHIVSNLENIFKVVLLSLPTIRTGFLPRTMATCR